MERADGNMGPQSIKKIVKKAKANGFTSEEIIALKRDAEKLRKQSFGWNEFIFVKVF